MIETIKAFIAVLGIFMAAFGIIGIIAALAVTPDINTALIMLVVSTTIGLAGLVIALEYHE